MPPVAIPSSPRLIAPPPRGPRVGRGRRPAGRAALVVLVLLLVSLIPSRGALAANFPVTREQVVLGTTTGIAGIQAQDGLSEYMTEANSGSYPVSYSVAQTVGPGVFVSGVFPAYLQSADNLYLRYRETLTKNQSQMNPATAGGVCAWTNCANGRTLNGIYATSNTNGQVATYGSFGFSLPAGTAILGVEVGYDAFEPTGNDQISVTLSWNGGTTYCSNPVAVSLPTADPGAYTYLNMTNCGGHTWSQADFTGNNIFTRFTYVQVGAGTISLDADVVRVTYVPPASYQLNVRYDFTGVPQGQDYTLTIVGAISDENLNVQVLTPPSTWNTRGTLTSTTNQVLTYRPYPGEVVGGGFSIRFVDALGPDAIQSDFWIDQVKLVTTVVAYGLDVRQDITGITGDNPLLLVKGNVTPGGENFNVQVWNFSSSTWDGGLTSPFTPSSQLYNLTLQPSEINGDLVRIRFADVNPNDALVGVLTLDFVAVSTSPPSSLDPGIAAGAIIGGMFAALLLFFYFFFWRRRSPEGEAPRRGRWGGGPKAPGAQRPPSVGLKPGHAYLVEEEKPYQSLNIMGDLTRTGKPGLLITRKNPKNLSGDFNLADTKTYWLAEAKAVEGSLILTPSLENILDTIDRFLKASPQGVVLLDGIEFLVDSNNFNSVLRFLRRTVDMVSQMEQILLVSVGPDTLQQRELRNLEREMDVLRLA